jgi:hypothetical protein
MLNRLLPIALLMTVGCAQLRYPVRTAMVSVTDPAPPPPQQEQEQEQQPLAPLAPLAPPARPMRATARHWRGLLAWGAVVTLIGTGMLIGGGIGWRHQVAVDAANNASCEAQGGWLCGLFDGLNEAPFKAVVGLGVPTAVSGLTLIGLGLDGHAHAFER